MSSIADRGREGTITFGVAPTAGSDLLRKLTAASADDDDNNTSNNNRHNRRLDDTDVNE